MANFEREERGQSQALRELVDRLGQLPLSELTIEQKWELHAATNGFFKPSERKEPTGDPQRR